MTSETRTFTGVGTYTLNYDYNLAGELKKITDPTNVTINYNYDSIGRMTGITGENNLFGGVSQYASGFTYRASGGLKSMTYGNNYTLAVSYNARLQGSLFEVAGGLPQSGPAPVMKTQYQYYDDGSLKFADGLTVADSDRAYSYDQAGRLKEAYSGSEALDYVNGTNSGTATGPYRQTYQNDAFGNLTSRVNRYWSHNDTFTASYTNNRQDGFQYDADGRLNQDSDLQYQYDAAGRSASIFSPAMNKSLTQTQDGDGQQVKRVQTQSGFTSTTYYLRSSVLGGRIVTELNQSGQKQKGYVFAGGQVLARQEDNTVVWQHQNPLTGTRGGSYTSGLYAYEVNPDPTGVNLGFNDPYNAPAEIELPEPYVPTLMGGNSSCGLNPNCTTCILSGFEADCNDVAHLLDIGAAEFHTPTTVYVRYTSGRTQTFPGYTNLPPGLDLRFTDSRAAIAFAWFDYHMPRDFAGGVNSAILHASQSYGDGGRSPNFLTGPASFFAPPQNPVTVPLTATQLKGLVQDRLDYGDCADYVNRLISQASKMAPASNPANQFKDITDLFDQIVAQPKGGFFFEAARGRVGIGSGAANGYIVRGDARITITPVSYYPNSPSYVIRSALENAPFRYGITGLHEVIHQAGKYWWNDDFLTRVAQKLEPDANISDWDHALQNHCLPANRRYNYDYTK